MKWCNMLTKNSPNSGFCMLMELPFKMLTKQV